MYRFKSRTTSDLLMHDAVGKQILNLLGKNPDAAGVLIWQDMAQARRLLMEAAQAEAQALKRQSEDKDAVDDAWDSAKPGQGIHLAQRIVPFLEVLKRCEAAQVDLVWGV
jgi:hypothetical protein